MSRLIFAPSVHLIAAPFVDPAAFGKWIAESGLDDVAQEAGTPLNVIADAVENLCGDNDADWLVEFAGRHCYRSWAKGRPHGDYIAHIIESGHGSVLEHATFTFAIAGVSRSLTHELVRHRAGIAVSQESQRFVDAKDMKFVVPPLLCEVLQTDDLARRDFERTCEAEVKRYEVMQKQCLEQAKRYGFTGTELRKRANEAARAFLPNMSETRLVWTVNARALRHVIALRGSEGADLEIRRLALVLLETVSQAAPCLFDDFFVAPSGYEGIPDTVNVTHPKV